MRQVVVEAKVCALRVHQRQIVACNCVASKCLLHPEYRLEAPDEAIQSAEGLRPIIEFDPVPLGMMAPGVLGSKTKGRVDWLPPQVCAVKILMDILQQAAVRKSNFQSRAGQKQACSAAG